MKRIVTVARNNWVEKVEQIGFNYHTLGKSPSEVDGTYWDETVCYEFTAEEVDELEAVTLELNNRCLDLVDHVVHNPDLMEKFGIPQEWRQYIGNSWNNKEPTLMGRFDLAYDPATKVIKMLEYNADTPTLVIETSLVQWFWKEEQFPNMDQWNSVHEKLLEQFKSLSCKIPAGKVLHFAGLKDYIEEYQHTHYFMDLAQQAGITAKYVPIDRIGWHSDGYFVDEDNERIYFCHKLYPWEWMAQEDFGKYVLLNQVGFIEPSWKMLLSNKAILPLLWEMFPNHPNLLASYWSPEKLGENYVKKPILAREGANIEFHKAGNETIVTDGSYANNSMIYQELANIPAFDGQYVILGSWIIGAEPAGLIIRENSSPIIVNTSKVVPHFFHPYE